MAELRFVCKALTAESGHGRAVAAFVKKRMPRATRVAVLATIAGVIGIAPWAAQTLALSGTSAGQSAATREWLIFVDDLHTPFVETPFLRAGVVAIVATLLEIGEPVTLRSVVEARHQQLDRAGSPVLIKQLHGNGLRITDLIAIPGDPQRLREVEYRAALSLGAAFEAVDDWQPHVRRRVIVYVSGGYLASARIDQAIDALTARAREQGVMFLTIDSRWLKREPGPDPLIEPQAWARFFATTRDSLRRIAESTGGFLRDEHVGLDDTLSAMARIGR